MIALLNDRFVPFAPGWGLDLKNPWWKETWKKLWHGKGQGWLHGTNLLMVTSTGRLLTGKVPQKGTVAQGLEDTLEAYAKLPETERRPAQVDDPLSPTPPPPPGGLVLTSFDRPLGRDGNGGYRLPRPGDLGPIPIPPGAQRDSVWVTAEECKALVPPDLQRGQTYPVPARLTKRLLLIHLHPQTAFVLEQTWRPTSWQKGGLNLTVEAVTPEEVRLRVHGSVLLEDKPQFKLNPPPQDLKDLVNRYDAHVEGVLVYDRGKDKIVRWDMAVLGDYTGVWRDYRKDKERNCCVSPVPMAFSFELDSSDYQLPPERRRARSFMLNYVFQGREQWYFDPEKWEEDWRKRSSGR